MIYFDNAATSYPKPPEVFEHMLQFMPGMRRKSGTRGTSPVLGAEAMLNEMPAGLKPVFRVERSARLHFYPKRHRRIKHWA